MEPTLNDIDEMIVHEKMQAALEYQNEAWAAVLWIREMQKGEPVAPPPATPAAAAASAASVPPAVAPQAAPPSGGKS